MNRDSLLPPTDKMRHFVGDDPLSAFQYWAAEEGWEEIYSVPSQDMRKDLLQMMGEVMRGWENMQRGERERVRELLRLLYGLLEPERSVTWEGYQSIFQVYDKVLEWKGGGELTPDARFSVSALLYIVALQYSRCSFQRGGVRRSGARIEDKFILGIPLSEMRKLERQCYPADKREAADAALRRAWQRFVGKVVSQPRWWIFPMFQFLSWCEPPVGWGPFRQGLEIQPSAL